MAIMEVVFLAHPHGLNFSALVAARDLSQQTMKL